MINMIRGPEDYERFLYGDKSLDAIAADKDQSWVKAVEEAIGFKLFTWQKISLYGFSEEYGRRTGKTLTWALRKLKAPYPIDITPEAMQSRNARLRCEYKMLIDVARKLDEHKVPHAPMCRTKKELNRCIYMLGRSNGKYPESRLINDL